MWIVKIWNIFFGGSLLLVPKLSALPTTQWLNQLLAYEVFSYSSTSSIQTTIFIGQDAENIYVIIAISVIFHFSQFLKEKKFYTNYKKLLYNYQE